ncbi:MAG: hypothetical protein B7733_26475 [Myxococcales bacterium FL481]|nr:MAG: hypothetical protein B7733_26475 [Myxococcales bacterium FL481]
MVTKLQSRAARSRWFVEMFIWAAFVGSTGCTQINVDAVDSDRDRPDTGAPQSDPAATVDKSASVAVSAQEASAATPVWIQLRDRADLRAVPRRADWSAHGRAIHASLATTAETAQASLRAFLDARGIRYRAYWAVNAVKANLDAATRREVEARDDVLRVFDERRYALPPTTPGQVVGARAIEWNVSNVRAPETWGDFGVRGEGIVVATIDSGVQFDHPALLPQYRGRADDGTVDHNYSWYDPSGACGATPCDTESHGTHTTGTIVGDDGGVNQIGVAPGARWISALGCAFPGCALEDLVSAGQWMLAPTDLDGQNPRPDLRPHIVSNSWGSVPADAFYREIVEAWVAAGIFPVFASGNTGPSCGSATSPGDYPESYAVGAYDAEHFIADFTSFGPSPFGVVKPNIAAPGVNVRSAVPFGQYASFNGTSMAAPHVAGAVALLWSGAPAVAGDIAATRALLDGSAIDRPDDAGCGGDDANNNTWGEGQLDVYALLSAAPIGPSGVLSGVVTDTDGEPIGRAEIAVSGELNRSVRTDSSGEYDVRLPVGSYATRADAFGYLPQTGPTVAIAPDDTTALDFLLDSAPTFALSGVVRDASGMAVAGARVRVAGTPFDPLVTGDDGRFRFEAVPQGEYSLRVEAGGCWTDTEESVAVDRHVEVDVVMEHKMDAYGYICREVTAEYQRGDTRLPLTGDDEQVEVALPFAVPFYGVSYETITVTANGYATFDGGGFVHYTNTPIPSAAEPNAAIYPLWDDLIPGLGGEIHTGVFGSAPSRRFVIEWRDVPFFSDQAQTASFSLTLHENGAIDVQYADTGSGPLARGGRATVGIEDHTGAVALQYSVDQPVLHDDLTVRYEIPYSGFVQGTIVDHNDRLPIAGATVRATSADQGDRSTTTNAAGEYRLQLTAGAYRLEISQEHYGTVTKWVRVFEDYVWVADAALTTARVEPIPTSFQLVLGADETRSRDLVLLNTGTASTPFLVREGGGQPQRLAVTRRLDRREGADPLARTAEGLFGDKPAGAGVTPAGAGDVLSWFAPENLEFGWGVVRIGDLWISDVNTGLNQDFSVEGVPQGHAFAASWAEIWPGDMTHDPTRDLICQLSVGYSAGIFCWDPGTGEVEARIDGDFAWSATSQRGLAYRASDDSFYTGGWNEGVVYHIAGLSHAQPGEVLSSCQPADQQLAGMAYDDQREVLWAATSSPTDTIYELDPTDCTVLSTLAPPQAGGYQGAGLDIDEDGNLWAVAVSPNRVYRVEGRSQPPGDVSWLSVAPAEGNLDPNRVAALSVQVDTTGLEPGLYLASLSILSDSARDPAVRVPVSVVVSGYVQAANTGGGDYTDRAGARWVMDRSYESGGWGYLEPGESIKTGAPIEGTGDQWLYNSQRRNPYAYRFDDVPNGVYEIDLRFAEFDDVDVADRMFDVIVEDTPVLPAYDIFYKAGRLVANEERFFVEVEDERLDVRLLPRSGAAVINGLRVRHRPDR